MNAFYEHHQDSIRFGYRCFDRILLNGLIQPFQQPERVIGFFNTYRNQYPVSREVLRDIADQFQDWVKNRSQKWGVPILDAPPGRRDEFVEPYFQARQARRGGRHPQGPRTGADPDRHRQQEGQPLAPAIRPALGHPVQLLRERPRLGPDVRARSARTFPFPRVSASTSTTGWRISCGRRASSFQQCTNAFLKCREPAPAPGTRRLPDRARPGELRGEVADALHPVLHRPGAARRRLSASPVLRPGRVLRQPDLPSAGRPRRAGRAPAGCQSHHRPADQAHGDLRPQDHQTLSRPAADRDRGSRSPEPGHPQPLRPRVHQAVRPRSSPAPHRGGHQQRDATTRCPRPSTISPSSGRKLSSIVDTYLDVQQDILETFVDRGQLRTPQPAHGPPERQTHSGPEARSPAAAGPDAGPGRFSHIAAGNTFTTAELHAHAVAALGGFARRLPPLVAALRAVQAPREGLGRETPALSTLPAPAGGLSHLPGLSQTLRPHLRTAHGRALAARLR